ncbi:MAG: polysaccharide deacetylase family protein, partial [Humidesulfovibrio sp.]|nr:polysaccharide deacetylase family protein [Humidesulfovibrio sp.]
MKAPGPNPKFLPCLCLFSLLLMAVARPCLAAGPPQQDARPRQQDHRQPLTFGSSALVSASHGLWSAAELAGTEADRVIGAVGEPDPSFPEPTGQEAVLPPTPPDMYPPELRGVIRRVHVRGRRKVVAVTFDLCERANNVAGYNDRIINLLRAGGHKATFFAGGKWMRSHPEKAMQLMADPRFELGSHTWTHGNLALMDQAQIRTQMEPTQAQYALLRQELSRRAEAKGLAAQMALVPPALRVMRLPYGRSSALALEELARSGYPVIQWDVEGERDEEVHSPAMLAKSALADIRPGSIVLL